MFQIQIRLLKHILNSQFGDVIEQVGYTLASKGPLPLLSIIHITRLGTKQVKEALFVLIHHNLVQYRPANDDDHEHSNRAILYRIDIKGAILRLAFPVFFEFLFKQYSDNEAMVFQEVVKFGRLSRDRLLEGSSKSSLEILLKAGFLESIQVNSSVFGDQLEDQSPNNLSAGVASTKRPNPSSPAKMAKKTKIDPGISESSGEYVRICPKAFVISLWHESLIEHSRQCVNDSAAAVMKALLVFIGEHHDGSMNFAPFQVSMKLPSDTKLLIDNAERDLNPTASLMVAQYLDYLSQDIDFLVKVDNRTEGLYKIDFNKSARQLKMNCIETFIRTKFGQPSVRIFRILWDRKMLEEKTISKIAMIIPKEARERLYQLLRVGLVALQEVPKTLDHAPSRTFFLWHIPLPVLYSTMSGLYLKAFINILDRISFERHTNDLLISKSERSDVIANPSLLSQADQKQLLALRKSLNRLTFHLNRIAREYLIFEYFPCDLVNG